MARHVAVLQRPYDRLLLDGRKSIESRLSKSACPPFAAIAPGETIHFKLSAGPFFAAAEAARVLMVDQLTPTAVADFRKQYDQQIGGTDAYWASKRDARFATLIWLRDLRPDPTRPPYRPQSMRAWYVLDEPATGRSQPSQPAPAFSITLTPAAIRQSYVRLGEQATHLPEAALGGNRKDQAGQLVQLRLDGGPTIETDIVASQRMFRSRAWGKWFAQQGVEPGWQLDFHKRGRGRFDVSARPSG